MTTVTCPDVLGQSSDTTCFLSSTLKHEKDVAALANLDDTQLLTFVKKSFKSSRRTQMAKAALNLATTFERIATLLAAQESTSLLAKAKQRATDIHAELVNKKSVVPSGVLIQALGITRQALSKAVQANRMFSVEVGGENYYPVFYADTKFDRRKLERVTKLLGKLDGWQKWQFFTTPKASLGGLTPLEAMSKGSYESVAKAAAGFAER